MSNNFDSPTQNSTTPFLFYFVSYLPINIRIGTARGYKSKTVRSKNNYYLTRNIVSFVSKNKIVLGYENAVYAVIIYINM